MNERKTVLVCALNWGLGHATRCMPIINELLAMQHRVILATDGVAYHLWQKEYPDLTIETLPSYNVTYKYNNIVLNLIGQVPSTLFKTIPGERKRVDEMVKKYKVDVVISDNRFGCFHKAIPSIFMTHQVNPIAPKLLQALVNRLNWSYIRPFSEVWIPDFEGEPNLTGKLAHGHSLKNTYYLGPLTRMKNQSLPIKNEYMAVISGPEPQRTYLQEAILEQAKALDKKAVIVLGRSNVDETYQLTENVRVHSFMKGADLNRTILESEVVLTRSGYTTLMDLAELGKKAIVIPTPGQTEQEFLAKHFMKTKVYYAQSQKDFNLKKALEVIPDYKGIQAKQDKTMLKARLKHWLG